MTGAAEVTFRVLPAVRSATEAFWTGGAEGRLMIHRCRACTRFFHPPASACWRCRSTDVGPEEVSGRATVAAYTVNMQPWIPGFPPPYVVAIVELADEPDVRLTTNIVGCAIEDVHTGLEVQVRFEQWEDVWLPMFAPVPA
ncbi:MAG TPA: OB-fold domain-containing protein [Mycobacteriales bacterium]|nr:OB-fold domain-containing protein [Mycobacteriales bacterium]